MKTTTGISESAASVFQLFEYFEAGHVGQPQIEHDAIGRLLTQLFERLGSASHRHNVDVLMPEKLGDAHLLRRIVFDHEQPLLARLRIFLDARKRSAHPFGAGRLGDEGERAAGQAVLTILIDSDDLHRDMARLRVLLELAQHRPTQHVRQKHVERHRRGTILVRQVERIFAARRDQHFETLVMGKIHHDACIMRIVFHDEQHCIARLDVSLDRPESAQSDARAAPQ